MTSHAQGTPPKLQPWHAGRLRRKPVRIAGAPRMRQINFLAPEAVREAVGVLARRWGCSHGEAMRKAIVQAVGKP